MSSVKVILRVEVEGMYNQSKNQPMAYETAASIGEGGNISFVAEQFIRLMDQLSREIRPVIEARFGPQKESGYE